MKRKRRRSSKEPAVPAGSVFAPVIEAARAMIHVLSTTFDDPDAETRSLRLERVAGMETILTLCTRAAAGRPLDPDTAVMGPLVELARAPAPEMTPPLPKALTLEERMERLERLVASQFRGDGGVWVELPDSWTRPPRPMPSILETPTRTNGAPTKARAAHTEDGKLRAQDRRLLEVLVQRTSRSNLATTNVELGILSGYSVWSGGFGQALGRLRAAGLITGSSAENRATLDGLRRAEAEPLGEALPTGKALIDRWLHRIKGQDSVILGVLCRVYPSGLTLEELTKETGYSPKSGGFGQALGRLRHLELVNRGWPMRANATFFLDGDN